MASERLFGVNISPACKHCEHTLQSFDNDTMLCEKRGVVSKTHKCRHFIYDPLKRVPQKPKPLEFIEESEFEI